VVTPSTQAEVVVAAGVSGTEMRVLVTPWKVKRSYPATSTDRIVSPAVALAMVVSPSASVSSSVT